MTEGGPTLPQTPPRKSPGPWVPDTTGSSRLVFRRDKGGWGQRKTGGETSVGGCPETTESSSPDGPVSASDVFWEPPSYLTPQERVHTYITPHPHPPPTVPSTPP